MVQSLTRVVILADHVLDDPLLRLVVLLLVMLLKPAGYLTFWLVMPFPMMLGMMAFRIQTVVCPQLAMVLQEMMEKEPEPQTVVLVEAGTVHIAKLTS